MTLKETICPICLMKVMLHGYESQDWIDKHIFEQHKKEWNEIAKETEKAHKMGMEIKNKFGVATIFTRKQYMKER